MYEGGSFRHDNPYKLASFQDAALKGRLMKRIDRLQAQLDRDQLSDEHFAERVAALEHSIATKDLSHLDTTT